METRTAFITGATGFLGLNLVEELLSDGWKVIALHRPASDVRALEKLGIDLVEGAIDDLASLKNAIPESAYAVFHVAGNTSLWSHARDRQFQDNVIGTRCMVEASINRGVRRFIHTSSVVTYGVQKGIVTEASSQLGDQSKISYFRTKALAEYEVKKASKKGLDIVIMNPANIIGRHDHHNWSRMIRMVYDEKLPGVPPGAGSFCHAREVARAHIKAAEIGGSSKNYLLGGADATFLELIQIIASIVERTPPKRVSPAFLLSAVGRFSQWWSHLSGKEPDITPDSARLVSSTLYCSSERAIEELGYQPASLEAMVSDCVEWMKSQGLLSPRCD